MKIMKHHEQFVPFQLHWQHNPMIYFLDQFFSVNSKFTFEFPPRLRNLVPEYLCDRRQIKVK
jgi:hypothetical protein